MAMWTKKCTLWRFFLCSLLVAGIWAVCIEGVNADEQDIPSESQCRPYIEKALKDLEAGDTHSEASSTEISDGSSEEDPKEEAGDEESSVEILTEEPTETGTSEEDQGEPSVEVADEPYVDEVIVDGDESENKAEDSKEASVEEAQGDEPAQEDDSKESAESGEATEEKEDSTEGSQEEGGSNEASAEENKSEDADTKEDVSSETQEVEAESEDKSGESGEQVEEGQESQEDQDAEKDDSGERVKRDVEEDSDSKEGDSKEDASKEQSDDSQETTDSKEEDDSKQEEESKEAASDDVDSKEDSASKEESKEQAQEESKEETQEETDSKETDTEVDNSKEDAKDDSESKEEATEANETEESGESADEAKEEVSEEKEVGDDESSQEQDAEGDTEEQESSEMPEEDLLMEIDIPENLRSREHISQLLRLDEESTEPELLIEKSADVILRDLKKLYDSAIKPLEILYKYRDLSNRHFGDPEIFSKPLVLFMGPWSGGKSSLINYLTDNEFSEWSLRTGAEPSPAYFNILMYGTEPQVLDGTQLAADWTFSGLQKFGQGLEERLRGLKLPNKLLEKVNIVEIPGILEVRKQVSRMFPFNDACQWFIDRADIIFLVYDPSKLDVGPETEAILDQLKGREAQTRILLNKADQVKPEELMRVQSALIWNISPLMSSAQPPAMYTTSLWSMPYESGAPARLLQAQERSFLKDLRSAIDKRVDNKISSARRFAVRVRNHAKMVDCYLTTYFNHKTIFGNKKVVAEAIIEHPQNYHIYEGLSTLTNISRYDLPDPETYRDFFRLNPLYDFQQLSATCTYFRGCPINRLDVAIAYDLPELVGKYKKMVETATPQGMPKS